MENANEEKAESKKLESEKQNTPVPEHKPDTVHNFISDAKKNFEFEFLKNNIRATPSGLFVSEAGLDTVLQKFQSWLEVQSAGEVLRSKEKCMKRLFDTLMPDKFYVIEGKNSLNGFLIKSEIKDIQRLGIPSFLGALFSSKSFIHPSDSELKSIAGLEVQSSFEGSSFKLAVGGAKVAFTGNDLQRFMKLAEFSPRVAREFPNPEGSLIIALKTICHLLKKSRHIPDKGFFLVPLAYEKSRSLEYRGVGDFIFIFSKQQTLLSVYELKGKNLYYFVRKELLGLKLRNIGAFELYGEKQRSIGRFKIFRREIELSSRALLGFIEQVDFSSDKRDKFPARYNIQSCFEKFSEIFQSAQPIEKFKISNYIENTGKSPKNYLINGNWIFVLSKDDVIESCIAKHDRRFRKPGR